MVAPASRVARTSLLALVCLGPLGCVGHGAVTYHGTVMSGEQARHVFVNNPSIDAPPLEGARVVLFLLIKERTCDEAAQWPHASITGPDGKYRRERTFGSMMWTPDKVFLLCVSHPDHEPYEYRMVYEKTPRAEKNGTKFLNFYLRRKSAAEANGGK